MKKLYLHSPVFRLFAPPIYGFLVYFLILMFFGTVRKLAENFFTFELLFCILLTYLIFEIQRIVVVFLNRRFGPQERTPFRMLVQLLLCATVVVGVISLIISLYYEYLVQFNTYQKELLIFNSIYFFTSVLYCLIYFSFIFLNSTNAIKIRKEQELMQSTAIELENYRGRINPSFLYRSLEDLIILARKDGHKASDYIQNLADIYRYVLSNKTNEPTDIEKEVMVAQQLIGLLNIRYENQIDFESSFSSTNDLKLIPVTMLVLVQHMVEKSIVSCLNPLHIRLSSTGNNLLLESDSCQRLEHKTGGSEWESMNKSYVFYTGKEIEVTESDNQLVYTIPMIRVCDEVGVS